MTPLPPSALEQLQFLAGHWRGAFNDAVIEEMWLAPRGGVAQATVRLVQGEETHTIELIVVSAENDRVVMRFNHFNRDLSTWERDGPITLTLTGARGDEVVFTNLETPARHAVEVGYRAEAERMTSWVVALNDNGTRTRHEFDYRRLA